MTTAALPFVSAIRPIPADRADNAVVLLLIENSGVIDQRSSWQSSRDERLATLEGGGNLDDAVAKGFVTVHHDKRGRVVRLVPAVGMAATLHLYTDSHAYEIIAVSKSGSKVTLRALKATRDPNWKREFTAGGFVGHTHNDADLKYCYESNHEAPTITATRCKDGSYKSKGLRVHIGVGREYYDSNF